MPRQRESFSVDIPRGNGTPKADLAAVVDAALGEGPALPGVPQEIAPEVSAENETDTKPDTPRARRRVKK